MDQTFSLEKAWNVFLQKHPKTTLFQTPEMAKVYSNTKGYEAIPFLAISDQGKICASLLAHTTLLVGTNSKRVVVQSGPLHADTTEGIAALRMLLQNFSKKCAEKAIYTEIRNFWDQSSILQEFAVCGLQFEDHLAAILDLRKSETELWKTLKQDKRKGVEKAKQRFELDVQETTDLNAVEECYRILQDTFTQAGHPLPHKSLFSSLLQVLHSQGAKLLFVVKNGERIAVQVALFGHGIIHAWYTGTKREFRHCYAGDLLIWHLISYGATNQYHTFDFGGGGPPNVEYGPRTYKTRFGAEFPNYGLFKCVYSPQKVALAQEEYDKYGKSLVKQYL
jgi:serine/alanine adding enzyme